MKRIWLLLLLWAALWLGGSVFSAWGLQQQIKHAANTVLAEQTEPSGASPLRAVAFGQHVVLEGTIHRKSDLRRATELIMTSTRLPGTLGRGRSVQPIHHLSTDRVRLNQRPVGWGVLAGTAEAIRLRGATASAFEAQSIASSLSSDSAITRLLHNEITTERDTLVEADDLQPTLTSPLPLTEKELQSSVLAMTRWGQPWQVLELDQPVETIRRRMIEIGLPPDAWHEGVSADVERVRDAHFTWRTNEAQRHSLDRQPPGHIVLAVRADTILLRGELGSPSLGKLVADAFRILPGDRRVIDEMSHSTHRKPENDARLLTTTIPAIPGGLLTKRLAVGTPATGWKLIDLASIDVEDETTLGMNQLPNGLDPRLVLPDVLACLRWIHSINETPSRAPNAMPLPHLLIAAVADRIYVRGAVAEESTRSQIESAARKLYAARSVDFAIRVDATCEPTANMLQTTSTLPIPPAINTTGLLALAVPGRPWKAKPMRLDYLDSDGLTRSNLLPDYVTPAQVMPDLISIADEIRAHLGKVINSAPGIPLQAP